eukprot:351489-Chlamydomonas_euryale.AAC.7
MLTHPTPHVTRHHHAPDMHRHTPDVHSHAPAMHCHAPAMHCHAPAMHSQCASRALPCASHALAGCRRVYPGPAPHSLGGELSDPVAVREAVRGRAHPPPASATQRQSKHASGMQARRNGKACMHPACKRDATAKHACMQACMHACMQARRNSKAAPQLQPTSGAVPAMTKWSVSTAVFATLHERERLLCRP